MSSFIAQRRADGSFVINNELYHVPNLGEWAEQWAKLNALWEADPAQFEQLASPEPSLPSLDEARTARLVDLGTAFIIAESSGWLTSSLGFDIDATERADRDVAGLITVMSQPGAPESTYFCDHHNQMRLVTLANLKTMQLEIIAYGQQLYAQKWQIRTAIETAETVDAVRAVVIAFGADLTDTDATTPETTTGTDAQAA